MRKQRVLTAKGRKVSSTKWIARHINDDYVIMAKKQGFRSRAAFKLLNIDLKYQILKTCKNCIIDLGCAPGSWLQVIKQKANPATLILGVDIIEVQPIDGTIALLGDFTEQHTITSLISYINNRSVDFVVSDMAAPASGDRHIDHIRIMHLVTQALHFSILNLCHDGHFIAKLLQGNKIASIMALTKKHFKKVELFKPEASYKDSSEIFLIALGKNE
ncbi:Ribosomal RNA large subunit methyltransferase E [Alphaproteobacteria bacterium]